MMLKVLIGEYINEKGDWFVEGYVDAVEILQKQKHKKLEKFLRKQKDLQVRSDGMMRVNDIIEVLKQNRHLHREYKEFIDYAIEQQVKHQNLALDVCELCKSIHNTRQRVIKDDMPQRVVDLVNYVADRSLIQELPLNEMCILGWEYVVSSKDWLDSEIDRSYETRPQMK